MSCECDDACWDAGDADCSQRTLSDEPRVSAREYQCDECYGEIPAKALHRYIYMLVDGDPSEFRMCAKCARIWGCHRQAVREISERPNVLLEQVRCAVRCLSKEHPSYLAGFRKAWHASSGAAPLVGRAGK